MDEIGYTYVGHEKGWLNLNEKELERCRNIHEKTKYICIGLGGTFRKPSYGFPMRSEVTGSYAFGSDANMLSLIKSFNQPIVHGKHWQGKDLNNYYFVLKTDSEMLDLNPHVMEFWDTQDKEEHTTSFEF